MAEEEKDEQVIVIEDLEEEGEKEEAVEERTEEPEGEKKGALEPQGEPSGSSSQRQKKRFILAGLAVFALVLSVLIAYFVFKKQPATKQPAKARIRTQKKVVVHKKEIKKAEEHGNIVRVARTAKNKSEKKSKKVKPYNPLVDVHFINALRLQAEGEYVAAINELKQATLDLYLSYFNIGYLYLKMGDVEKAKEYLIDKTERYLLLTIENNPDYLEAYVNLFKVYMASQNYRSAKKIIDFLSKKRLPKSELDLMKTYYDFVVNDNETSVEAAFKKYPSSALLNALMGELYLNRGEVKKAVSLFDKALRMYDMGGVYYDRMLADVDTGHYKRASDDIPRTYYMEFSRIPCKNYLSFFVLLHENKFKAAYKFLNLNRRFYPDCYRRFRITPISISSIGLHDLIVRRNIPYMVAAEIMNMYLKPVKFTNKGMPRSLKMGKLYESLGLPSKAVEAYSSTASFAEAVLLSERASRFYVYGDIKNALKYYKMASEKLGDSDPVLLYDVALMEMKLHRIDAAEAILNRLNNAYPDFPLPYFGLFIVKEFNTHHRDAMQELSDFIVRLKSINTKSMDMKELGVIADLIANGVEDRLDGFPEQTKRLFLVVKAALDDDLAFLTLERPFERLFGFNMDTSSNLEVLKYLTRYYPTDFIKRTLSDYYLIKRDYENAYRALFGIPNYNAVDYYKFGIAYLLDGYPEVADNFFTKSILNGVEFYNAYVAKEIIQAMKGDYQGVLYYMKIILKKERAWLNTDVNLSFRINFLPDNESVTSASQSVYNKKNIK